MQNDTDTPKMPPLTMRFFEALVAPGQGLVCAGLCQASEEELREIKSLTDGMRDSVTMGIQTLGDLISAAAQSGELGDSRIGDAGGLVRMLGEFGEVCDQIIDEADHFIRNPEDKERLRERVTQEPA